MWTEEGEGGRKGQRPGTALELITIMTQKHNHSTGESPNCPGSNPRVPLAGPQSSYL